MTGVIRRQKHIFDEGIVKTVAKILSHGNPRDLPPRKSICRLLTKIYDNLLQKNNYIQACTVLQKTRVLLLYDSI